MGQQWKCYSVPNNNGNKGLIKVIRADEFDTGSIEFSLKMQL